MSTFVALTVTGLSLGALYFLLAAGLALVFGLMDVLNFAHGALLTIGSFAAWYSSQHLHVGGAAGTLGVAILIGLAVGGAVAALIELALIRPLYGRQLDQVLVTVGLALAITALVQGVWGTDARPFPVPHGLTRVLHVAGTGVPVADFVIIAIAVAVWAALTALLRWTGFGLVIRAGVENRAMVSALGIDVRRAFTVVFTLGGVVAALGGALTGVFSTSIDPSQGGSFLIFAIIVVVIGGLGSVSGSAVAALVVALLEQYVNYYAAPNVGDLTVMLLLAVVLLIRPQGLAGTAR